MKTILFVSPTGTLDNGAEISIYNLMKFLSLEGHKVINVAPTYQNVTENEYTKRFKEYKIECILLNPQRWWWEDAPGHLFGTEEERAISYRKNICEIVEIIKKKDVDIVISNTINVFQGAVASALVDKPHYWLIHEFPDNEFAYYMDKLDFINDFSSEIFAVRGQLNKRISELIKKRKIKSFAPYTEIEEIILKKANKKRIMSIGRITERKNQLELIKAFEKLSRKDIELVFIGGSDEAYKNKCMKYIDEKKLKNIFFLGNKKNPWAELTDKDICVFPSSMETFGLVYVEALLNGIPVILSDNPGHTSAYEMFEFGQKYHLGNIDELVEKIENTLENFTEIKEAAISFAVEAKNIYKLPIVYQEIMEEINTNDSYRKNSIRHISSLLTTNEKKSKLAKLEFRVRQKLQRVKYKIFKK